MGDFPINLVQAPVQPRFGRVKAASIGVVTLAMCLTLAGATPAPVVHSPAFSITGMSDLPSPPTGSSWAPQPVTAGGLRMVATAGAGKFALHTASGDMTFLPGVNLGSTTPGHQPGELSISPAQYRSWFAGMGWLGIRVVRVYTIHPPAFYSELARYNLHNPDRPLFLMQGVYLPDESYIQKRNVYDKTVTTSFQRELQDAAQAVSGTLSRKPQRGRAGGNWTADVTPWLAGWIIGVEFDPYATSASDRTNASRPLTDGRYFRNTTDATPTERWLAARMDDLATAEAKKGDSQPIAFVNWPTTDPLRHPEEPLAQEDLLQLDANHVRPTANWAAGTFASYHAYPYYPDFQRHEPDLQTYRYQDRIDPYAGYLTALKKHHGDMPTLITEFGVPSAIGSAHNSPLGRTQGDHSEPDAMRIDAELLKLIKDQGLSAGFVFEWSDEWFKFTWNTVEHQDPERRQLWHDPMTNEQNFGLIAMDAAGSPDAQNQFLIDSETAWPAKRVTARVDESYLKMRISLGTPRPSTVTLGFDVLPGLTGLPAPETSNGDADAALTLNLVADSGQAYLRNELDPLPLDYPVPEAARGDSPAGWKPYQLVVDRALTIPSTGAKLPVELQNAGALRYGTPADDSRALWHLDGDDLVVRVPWALLGYADPSSHRVGVPVGGKLTYQVSPGVTLVVSSSGTDQSTGEVNWVNWNRPYYTERLKPDAGQFRDAAFDAATPAGAKHPG